LPVPLALEVFLSLKRREARRMSGGGRSALPVPLALEVFLSLKRREARRMSGGGRSALPVPLALEVFVAQAPHGPRPRPAPITRHAPRRYQSRLPRLRPGG